MNSWEVIHSSSDHTWRTPPDLFAEIDRDFRFELDAAALAPSALCADYFGPDHFDPARRDAFLAEWPAAPVWLNPPYGRGVGAWLDLAWRWSRRGSTVACLVMACTDTKWWHENASKADEIRLIAGRVRFLRGDSGKAASAAPKGSALVVFRPHVPDRGWPGGPRIYNWQTTAGQNDSGTKGEE